MADRSSASPGEALCRVRVPQLCDDVMGQRAAVGQASRRDRFVRRPGRQRKMAAPCARRVEKSSSGPNVAHCATQKESRRRRQYIGTHRVSDRRIHDNAHTHIQEKEQAIAAAYGFLDRGYRDALKVGPPSGNPEGRLLNKQNLQRVRSARSSRSGGIDCSACASEAAKPADTGSRT